RSRSIRRSTAGYRIASQLASSVARAQASEIMLDPRRRRIRGASFRPLEPARRSRAARLRSGRPRCWPAAHPAGKLPPTHGDPVTQRDEITNAVSLVLAGGAVAWAGSGPRIARSVAIGRAARHTDGLLWKVEHDAGAG